MSTPETPTPPRPTPAQLMAEVATAALTRQATPPEHTVSLKETAKGEPYIGEVTARGPDLGATAAAALMTFKTLREKVAALPPRGNGGVA